jgi:RND family efflux transporter MFP subunit
MVLSFSFSLAVLPLATTGCTKTGEYKPPPPPGVTVAKPLVAELTEELEYTGNLQATDAVQIRARVGGYLHKINFKDGQTVEEGDLLFEIEEAPFQAALDSAKASLLKAEANLALAEAELKRTSPLVDRGALSVAELDVKKAAVATANADVASAQANVEQAELNLGYTKVRAPLSGRIGRHMVDIGNLVEAQISILTTIEKYQPIHAYFNVSESDVPLLPKQVQLPATVSQSPDDNSKYEAIELGQDPRPAVFIGVPGENGFPHEGRLDFTQLGVDPSTGTQQRRAIFLNKDRALVPGLFIRVRVPFGEKSPRLLVPERAVGVDQRGEYVLVVNAENIVEDRRVELGGARSGLRIVKSGLKPDERVIVNGIQRARPASPVTPTEATELPGVDPELVKAAGRPSVESTPVSRTAQAGE